MAESAPPMLSKSMGGVTCPEGPSTGEEPVFGGGAKSGRETKKELKGIYINRETNPTNIQKQIC